MMSSSQLPPPSSAIYPDPAFGRTKWKILNTPSLFLLILTSPVVPGRIRISSAARGLLSLAGRCQGAVRERANGGRSGRFRRAIELFNAGYYWEAHEVWEELWHVEGRRGPTAELLKALIKLAAAGVKVREGQRTRRPHSLPARAAFRSLRAAEQGGPSARAGPRHSGLAAARTRSRKTPRGIPAPPGRLSRESLTFRIEPDSDRRHLRLDDRLD